MALAPCICYQSLRYHRDLHSFPTRRSSDLPRCKMRLKKRLLAFSRRLHARIRKTRYMHKMRCLLINRRSLLNRSEERFSRNAETELVCRLLLEKKKIKQMISEKLQR